MSPAPLAGSRLHDARSELEATFVAGAGMLCSSLRHRGEELLAQNGGVEAYAARGKTMGIPLLYPWANRLAGFSYDAAGPSVDVPHDPALIALDDHGLPIHGVIGGRMAWELSSGGGSEDTDSLSAHLSWSEEQPDLFKVFPFRHDLEYRASLAEGRLEIAVTVHASRAQAVPVAFGFHPYLSLPGLPRDRWLIDLPAMRALELDGDQIPVGAGAALPPRSFELAAEQFDDGFDDVPEPARFSVAGGGRRIALEFLEGYPCAQVYAPPSGRFICFEPMTARTNALRDGAGLTMLAPGEHRRMRFSVSVSDA